jgi:hypothetical protein
MSRIFSSTEVVGWPEYKAFAERLGIAELSSKSITIELRLGEPVVVVQEYIPKSKVNSSESATP